MGWILRISLFAGACVSIAIAPKLNGLIQAAQMIGPGNVFRAICYTTKQAVVNATRSVPKKNLEEIGMLVRIEDHPTSVVFVFSKGAQLEVCFTSSEMARTTWTPGVLPVPYAIKGAVAATTSESSNINNNDNNNTTSTSGGLNTSVPASHLMSSTQHFHQHLLPLVRSRVERLEGGGEVEGVMGWHRVAVAGDEGQIIVYVRPDGAIAICNKDNQTIRRELPPLRCPSTGAWKYRAILRDDERIYGLGDRVAGGFDLRGGSFRMWNTDIGGIYGVGRDPLYKNIPVVFGTHFDGSFMCFFENSNDAVFKIGGGFNTNLAPNGGGGGGCGTTTAGTLHRQQKSLLANLSSPSSPAKNANNNKTPQKSSSNNNNNNSHVSSSFEPSHFSSTGADFEDDELITALFEGNGALRMYTVCGTPAQCMHAYTDLTGRHPLPPQWALGFHQSRWSYFTVGEVMSVVEGFLRHDLPLSCVHLDGDYMRNWRIFTVDPDNFGDLKALTEKLDKLKIKVVTIIDPGVKIEKGYDVYESGVKADAYLRETRNGGKEIGGNARACVWPGWCVFPDFTSASAREWWGKQYPKLLEHGIAGVWHDMNEPAAFIVGGDPTLDKTVRHSMEGRGGSHTEGHNLFGMCMNLAGEAALRKLQPHKRPFILTRAGWAGMQRFGWTWTGDTESSWSMLRGTVAQMMGLGLSGVSFCGPDVGGFNGSPSAELFVRWMHLSCFLPFFRNHAALTTPAREPWVFGPQYLPTIRDILRLRYRILPLLYSLAWETCSTGVPMVRPIWWECDSVTAVALGSIDDEFLLGSSLLVCPVLENGANSRHVIFPPGCWYDFYSDNVYVGVQSTEISAPLDRCPLFIKAGSVLTLQESDKDELHLSIYPPPPSQTIGGGAGFLYVDEGEGIDCPSRFDSFELHWEGDESDDAAVVVDVEEAEEEQGGGGGGKKSNNKKNVGGNGNEEVSVLVLCLAGRVEKKGGFATTWRASIKSHRILGVRIEDDEGQDLVDWDVSLDPVDGTVRLPQNFKRVLFSVSS